MRDNYSEDFIEQVRFSNDLVDLVSDYTKLKAAGKGYKGLCPFHNEKTPSFNVNPDQQLYSCFGCGAGGDIFNFVMEIEGVSFVEAIKFLAQRAGLSLPEEIRDPKIKKRNDERKKLLQIHELTAKFYNYLLTNSEVGQQACDYLNNRGFDREIIDRFKLGYAPDRWEGLYKFLKNKGYSDRILVKSGLVISRKKADGYYDRFRNRAIFTIYNHRGQIIGFGGRKLVADDQPKYLNSPDTVIFDKGKNLYGLNWAKRYIQQSDEAVIMEGYTDVIRAHQFGINNAIASLGTSLTEEQANLLKRYAKRVYIAYDADNAGAKATLRGLDILKEADLNVMVIRLPNNQDPDEFIENKGGKEFERLKEEALSLVQFKLNSIFSDKDLSLIDDKVQAVKEISPILVKIEDELEKREYCKMVAERLDVELEVLNKELRGYEVNRSRRDRKSNYRHNNTNKTPLKERISDSRLDGHLQAVDELLRHIIKEPSLIDKLEDKLQSEDFIKKEYQQLVSIIFSFYKEDSCLDVNQLLARIRDKKVKDLLIRLSVKEDGFLKYTGEMVCDPDYIKKIK